MGCDGVRVGDGFGLAHGDGFGLAHGDEFGLELEPNPNIVDGGPHAPYASHPHGPSPCWVSPFGCLISKKKKRNL